MKRFHKYARNLGANWFGLGANMVVLFFLSPFVINKLGKVEYGIWSLLNVFTGYLGILDLGVRESTGRYVTLYIGNKDKKSVDEVIRSSISFFSIIGLFVLGVAFCAGLFFPLLFPSLPEEYHSIVLVLLPFLALNMWITTLRSLIASLLMAHDRFDLMNLIDVFTLTMRTIGTIAVLIPGYGISGLTMVVVTCNFAGLVITYLISKKIWKYLKLLPLFFSKSRLKELLGYGIAAFLAAVSLKVIGQTDLIIVGSFIGVSEVTTYSVGAMLVFYSGNFVGFIARTFFPPVQRAAAQEKFDDVKKLFRKQVRLALIFGIPLYVGFICFSKPFIKLWMLSDKFTMDSVDQASEIMMILALSKVLYLFTLGSKEILNSIGHVKISSTIAITEAFTNLIISIVLVSVFKLGLPGVAMGTLFARMGVSMIFYPYFACTKLNMDKTDFIKDVFLRGSLSILIFMGVCIFIRKTFYIETWAEFFIQVILVLILFIPIAAALLIPKDFKREIKLYFSKSKSQAKE